MLTEQAYNAIGLEIAELLNLSIDEDHGRYITQWGNKSAIGLARTIERIFEESKNEN